MRFTAILSGKFVLENLYDKPDYEYVHQELKRIGVTLKFLWQEYQDKCRASGSIPMGYTKYCQCSYMEPCRDMKMDSFIRARVHMYGFFGGVATHLVCDNLKAGVVSQPKEGEVILTADYEALSSHYQTAIIPAGIRKPKQKASVEGAVWKIATAIIARLRNETFYSFEELKAIVAKNSTDLSTRASKNVKEAAMTLTWMRSRSCIRCRQSLMRSPHGSMAGRQTLAAISSLSITGTLVFTSTPGRVLT